MAFISGRLADSVQSNLRILLRAVTLTVAALVLTSCGTILRSPSPVDTGGRAEIDGFENVRHWPLTNPKPLVDSIYQAYATESPDNYETLPTGERVYNYLAVSGGGSVGAFGAGILNGWTQRGDRPYFKVVTGISTGALIAPFAFLGPDYDAQLKEAYTTVDASHIFIVRRLLSILWSDSLTDTEPFKNLLAKYVDEKMLDAIAAEHNKGRRLYVGTTQLDREEPVIWDMGAIAASKSKSRVKLFRKVLLASASIPTLFPPVLMDVTVDGKKYDEMHVDGGVFFQAFFIGTLIDMEKALSAQTGQKGAVRQRLYVIRNGFISPAPKPVPRGLSDISLRAITTMLKMSGINDLYRLYLSSKDDNVEFRYVAMPPDYVPSTDEEFKKAEMNRQYDLGFGLALAGVPWQSVPPGYAAPTP